MNTETFTDDDDLPGIDPQHDPSQPGEKMNQVEPITASGRAHKARIDSTGAREEARVEQAPSAPRDPDSDVGVALERPERARPSLRALRSLLIAAACGMLVFAATAYLARRERSPVRHSAQHTRTHAPHLGSVHDIKLPRRARAHARPGKAPPATQPPARPVRHAPPVAQEGSPPAPAVSQGPAETPTPGPEPEPACQTPGDLGC